MSLMTARSESGGCRTQSEHGEHGTAARWSIPCAPSVGGRANQPQAPPSPATSNRSGASAVTTALELHR